MRLVALFKCYDFFSILTLEYVSSNHTTLVLHELRRKARLPRDQCSRSLNSECFVIADVKLDRMDGSKLGISATTLA